MVPIFGLLFSETSYLKEKPVSGTYSLSLYFIRGEAYSRCLFVVDYLEAMSLLNLSSSSFFFEFVFGVKVQNASFSSSIF